MTDLNLTDDKIIYLECWNYSGNISWIFLNSNKLNDIVQM